MKADLASSANGSGMIGRDGAYMSPYPSHPLHHLPVPTSETRDMPCAAGEWPIWTRGEPPGEMDTPPSERGIPNQARPWRASAIVGTHWRDGDSGVDDGEGNYAEPGSEAYDYSAPSSRGVPHQANPYLDLDSLLGWGGTREPQRSGNAG